jgi:hypothetical protein
MKGQRRSSTGVLAESSGASEPAPATPHGSALGAVRCAHAPSRSSGARARQAARPTPFAGAVLVEGDEHAHEGCPDCKRFPIAVVAGARRCISCAHRLLGVHGPSADGSRPKAPPARASRAAGALELPGIDSDIDGESPSPAFDLDQLLAELPPLPFVIGEPAPSELNDDQKRELVRRARFMRLDTAATALGVREAFTRTLEADPAFRAAIEAAEVEGRRELWADLWRAAIERGSES